MNTFELFFGSMRRSIWLQNKWICPCLPDRYKPTPEQLIQNQLLDRGIKENVRLKSQCAASAFA